MTTTPYGRPRRPLIAVDPPGCGCTECITSQYVPLEQARPEEIAALLTGLVENNTGLIFKMATREESPGTVHVIPLYAEDETPVADDHPSGLAWEVVAPGWNLDRETLAQAAAAAPAAWTQPGSPGIPVAEPGPRSGGCACSGRSEGKHDFLCEQILRRKFGDIGNVPDDVKQQLRDRKRMIPGTVVSDQPASRRRTM